MRRLQLLGLVVLTSLIASAMTSARGGALAAAPTASLEQGPAEPYAGDTLLYLPIAQRNVDFVRSPWPPDGQEGVSLNANLTWTIVSAQGARFRVYLEAGDTTPDLLVGDNLTVHGVDAPELASWSAYYWQVVTEWPDGSETSGPVWRFSSEGKTLAPALGAMVTVPEGSFRMGCDRSITTQYPCSWNAYHQDEPVRSIWLDAYAIDKYEVTNSEYRKCVESGVCQPPRRTLWYGDPRYDLAPVVYVSWWDAQGYCGWEGKRMPTEAEWEKAARGSLDTRVYPWGNQEPDCTRVYHQAIEHLCAENQDRPDQVGTRPTGASPYGAHDMAGNVFEWVRDRYDVWYYNYGPVVNPQGPEYSRVAKKFGDPMQPPPRDEYYVPVFTVRGGTYANDMHYMRVSHRHWGHHGDKPFDDYPWFRNRMVGFRCAVSK